MSDKPTEPTPLVSPDGEPSAGPTGAPRDRVVRGAHRASDAVRRQFGAPGPADSESTAGSEAGDTNPSGETQVGTDVFADRVFCEELGALDCVGWYVSEERAQTVDCGEGYSVAVDPLDGSSNLAPNNAVGSIVGVYDAQLPAPGRELVAALITLYGPTTTLTVARADTDTVYTYRVGDVTTAARTRTPVPTDPTVVGLAGRTGERTHALEAIAADLEADLKCRYGGATVADVAQVIEYGGLFGYPATTDYPDGKLRVHFEAAPLAYLVEALDGASTDGTRSLLAVDPDDLHARTPTFLGTPRLVDRVETIL
jgi:fructose-1,6-bisphosphatase I